MAVQFAQPKVCLACSDLLLYNRHRPDDPQVFHIHGADFSEWRCWKCTATMLLAAATVHPLMVLTHKMHRTYIEVQVLTTVDSDLLGDKDNAAQTEEKH